MGLGKNTSINTHEASRKATTRKTVGFPCTTIRHLFLRGCIKIFFPCSGRSSPLKTRDCSRRGSPVSRRDCDSVELNVDGWPRVSAALDHALQERHRTPNSLPTRAMTRGATDACCNGAPPLRIPFPQRVNDSIAWLGGIGLDTSHSATAAPRPKPNHSQAVARLTRRREND